MSNKILVVDLETYYDNNYSLSRMTVPEYVHDPRFHIHGIAIRHPDATTVFEFDAAATITDLQRRYGVNLENVTVVVHNGFFDLYVFAKNFGIIPPHTVDTMQLANAILGRRGEGGQSASLGAIAKTFGLQDKGDIKWLSGIRCLSGMQKIDLAAYAKHDVVLTHAVLEQMLPQVSNPAVELRIAAHTLRLHHQRGLTVDASRIDGLIAEIRQEAKVWFDKAGITPDEAASRKDFNEIFGQALARTGRQVPTKPGKNGPIPATGKKDEAMQAFCEDEDAVVNALANARLTRGSETQHVARLETLRRIATATGNILPVHLVYHGAGTGRFAGGGKFNLQNLPKAGLGSKIRGLIQPAPGCAFVLVDLAQIECRITAWLANETLLLRAFAENIDIYSREATAIFGCEVRKSCPTDDPTTAKKLDAMRQTGKQEVLGLGFQMGALRFMDTLRSDPKTARLFDDGLLSPKKCKEIVDHFRSEFGSIAALWQTSEGVFRSIALGGSAMCIGHAVQAQQTTSGLELRLPSSRVLRYPRLRTEIVEGEISCLDNEGNKQTFLRNGETLVYGDDIKIFGGKIVENMAQAIARDILVEAILRLERRGIEVILHIHDEIIVMCPKGEAATVEAAIIEEMTRTPAWAPGLPLAAEGRIAFDLTK